ncbi:GNAT family N-acetyltransferase [Croceicoccus marinus]|nr:GNAT family N-acetyltransferase [Croceicoccus marinus]
MSISFRRATRDDLPAIVMLLADDVLGRSREIGGEPLDPRYVAGFEAVDADPRQTLVVAELDGDIVGTMQITILPGIGRLGAVRGQFESVHIAESLRGQGHGAAMIRWAMDHCREQGCAFVQLTSDRRRAGAHSFYEGLGFAPSHVGYKKFL